MQQDKNSKYPQTTAIDSVQNHNGHPTNTLQALLQELTSPDYEDVNAPQ